MIDIHTHILPNIDDGANSLDEAIDIIKIQKKSGVSEIIATPHLYKGNLSAKISDVSNAYTQLMDRLLEENIDIKIHTGHEICFHSDVIEMIRRKEFMTLADSDYILIELSNNILDDVPNILYEIKLLGYIPILAHIERYNKIYQNEKLLKKIINEGVHLQINADSIFANHRSSEYKFSKYLLDNNLVCFIATDCHNTTDRKPALDKCYNKICAIYGKKYAEEIFCNNPRSIISNNIIEYKYLNIKRKGILQKIFNN